MTKNVDEVALEFQSYAAERDRVWDADARPRPDIDTRDVEKIVERSLDVLGLESNYDAFVKTLSPTQNPKDLSFQQALNLLGISLKDDIEQCLNENQKGFLQNVHFRFLSTGLTNASCLNADVDGEPLGFFIAFLNEGLYFSLRQLFTALLYEELRGELAEYQRDGSDAFEAAVRLYIDPNPVNIAPLSHYVGDIEASGEIGAHIDSAASLLLQFIALHEYAHAWLGHHEIIDAQSLFMAAKVGGVDNLSGCEIYHDLEFQADEFAFRALMSRTKTAEGHWAHCFAIHLFFCYLAELEKRLGKPLSHLHPSPMLRSERLRALLKNALPESAHLEADIFRVDAMVEKWTTKL